MPELFRMWINQPSMHSDLYHLHGVNVLAYKESGYVYRVYFLSGNVISARVLRSNLSFGWINGSSPL